jgi:hypothetical protein
VELSHSPQTDDANSQFLSIPQGVSHLEDSARPDGRNGKMIKKLGRAELSAISGQLSAFAKGVANF